MWVGTWAFEDVGAWKESSGSTMAKVCVVQYGASPNFLRLWESYPNSVAIKWLSLFFVFILVLFPQENDTEAVTWHTSKPRRQLVCRNNSGKISLKQLCQGNCKKLKQERRLTQTLGESHRSQRTPPPPAVTLPETKRSPEWEGGLK